MIAVPSIKAIILTAQPQSLVTVFFKIGELRQFLYRWSGSGRCIKRSRGNWRLVEGRAAGLR
jgi:hypothetical protein